MRDVPTMFGDPTGIGFLTTAAYLGVAAVCLVWRGRTRIPAFFAAVGASMFALGVNKEADLQRYLIAGFTAFATKHARDVSRDLLRAMLVAGTVCVLVFALAVARRLARPAPGDARITLVGLMVLACFVIARATSFVHLGSLQAFFFAHPSAVACLELPGIFLVLAGARSAVLDNEGAS
jgi:hypothetical protein